MHSMEEWINEYQKLDAYWMHDGNKERPHALLTSGLHSNGFFNSRFVIPHEELLREAASDLRDLFIQNCGRVSKFSVVVGPQTGATKLAELLRDECDALTGKTYFSASPAKTIVNDVKSMTFTPEETALIHGRSVLLCEDVITTGGSIELTAVAVQNAGGTVLPFVTTLVNRSGLTQLNGRKIIPLIHRNMPMWRPEDCPLCKQGSEAIRPKENWQALNASY